MIIPDGVLHCASARKAADFAVSPHVCHTENPADHHLRRHQVQRIAADISLHINPKRNPTVHSNQIRHHVEFLSELLKVFNISCCEIYGSMDQASRKTNLSRFKYAPTSRNGSLSLFFSPPF
jgi:superfamily II DNA/RNA helicase